MKLFKILSIVFFVIVLPSIMGCNNEIDTGDIQVTFSYLTANGIATEETTTELTLTFDRDIPGLSTANIILAAGNTGASKGALRRISEGVYALELNSITQAGQIVVAIERSGFAVYPMGLGVNVYKENEQFIVTFHSGGGTAVAAQTVRYGNLATEPFPAPRRTGLQSRLMGWYDETFTYRFSFTATLITENLNLYARWAYFDIGNIGPGGGRIFYRSEAGFTLLDIDPEKNKTVHHLEAAPINSGNAQWGANHLTPPVTTFTAANQALYLVSSVGSGRRDTQILLDFFADRPLEIHRAAQIAAASRFGGFDDWFLPSIGELHLLWRNRFVNGLGTLTNMSNAFYSTSSQGGPTGVWLQGFEFGNFGVFPKTDQSPVRAVRAF